VVGYCTSHLSLITVLVTKIKEFSLAFRALLMEGRVSVPRVGAVVPSGLAHPHRVAGVRAADLQHGQVHQKIHLDGLDHDLNYDPVRAYGASKLENILFTTELHRRYHASGLSAASFYPGNVVTNFASDTASPVMRLVRFLATKPLLPRLMRLSTPDQGADQIVWLAEGTPGTHWRSGAYYYQREACTPRNPQALDADLARGLWESSEELLAERLRDLA